MVRQFTVKDTDSNYLYLDYDPEKKQHTLFSILSDINTPVGLMRFVPQNPWDKFSRQLLDLFTLSDYTKKSESDLIYLNLFLEQKIYVLKFQEQWLTIQEKKKNEVPQLWLSAFNLKNLLQYIHESSHIRKLPLNNEVVPLSQVLYKTR
jgi:hypothetical protein